MHSARRRSAALLTTAILALTVVALDPVAAVAKPKKPAATTTTSTTTTSTTSTSTTTTSTTTTTTTTVAPAAAPTYANRKVETFDNSKWWTTWGMSGKPWNTVHVFAEGAAFQRVNFVQGTHSGTSWMFPTGTSDAVHLSYRLRLSSTFDASKSASNVKMPGFGTPIWDAAGLCVVACGGAPADGVTGWSARGDLYQSGVPGYYVYSLLNTWGTGYRWQTPAYERGRWYTVDLYVRMNDVGSSNGSLVAYLDGQKVFEKTDYVFRLTDGLHVGNVWLDFYYGGSGVVPTNMWIDIDDVVMEY